MNSFDNNTIIGLLFAILGMQIPKKHRWIRVCLFAVAALNLAVAALGKLLHLMAPLMTP